MQQILPAWANWHCTSIVVLFTDSIRLWQNWKLYITWNCLSILIRLELRELSGSHKLNRIQMLSFRCRFRSIVRSTYRSIDRSIDRSFDQYYHAIVRVIVFRFSFGSCTLPEHEEQLQQRQKLQRDFFTSEQFETVKQIVWAFFTFSHKDFNKSDTC